MRKIKKSTGVLNLTDKFINLLIQNGKKSKSKKLLANCCAYTNKLLKKNFLTFASFDTEKKKGKKLIIPNSLENPKFNDDSIPFGENRQKKNKVDLRKTGLLLPQNKKQKKILKKKQESKKEEQNGPSSPEKKLGKERQFQSPILFFKKSIKKVCPLLSLQKIRKGRRTSYIPRALSENKGMSVAIKWVIHSSKKREYKFSRSIRNVPKISQLISNELGDCFLEQGITWQKKEDLHKLGAANKASIRFNWW